MTSAPRSPLRSLLALPITARLSALLLLLAFSAALLGLLLPQAGAMRIDLSDRLGLPSSTHALGTDELGRDVGRRLLLGAGVSLGVAAAAVLLSVLFGSFLGLLAGERGGALDSTLGAVVDLVLAFPALLLAVALAAVLGPSARNTVIALTAVGWVPYARLARSEARRVGTLDFVAAARAAGASRLRLLAVHFLPNVAAPLTVQATLHLAGAILSESALSFLGLGVPPPAPSWGSMLAAGRTHMLDAPHVVLAPALAILLVVLATNLLGDELVLRLTRTRSAGAAIPGPFARRPRTPAGAGARGDGTPPTPRPA